MARMRRACLASAVRAASARNCEILKSWCVISIADMLPAPRINDMLHRVTVAVVWESPQESGSQAAGIRRPFLQSSDLICSGGTVTLPNRARNKSACMSGSRRSDDVAPRLHRRGPEGSVRFCGGEMALDVESVVSGCVG